MFAYRRIDRLVVQHEHFEACDEKRCKGTKKCGETIYREQMLFENKKHEVYTVNKHKIALNRDDDKIVVQADETTTLARGVCSAFGLNNHQRCFS